MALAGLLALGFLVGEWAARKLVFDIAIAPKEGAGREAGGRYAINDLVGVDEAQIGEAAVIFLDSTNDSMPQSDPDRRPISALMAEELRESGIRGYGVSFPGAGFDWIVTLLNYWTARFPGIDYAALPINLRWASPAWRGIDLNDDDRRPLEFLATGAGLPSGLELGYRSPKVRADRLSGTAETVIGPVPFDVRNIDLRDFADEQRIPLPEARRKLLRQRFALAYGTAIGADDPIFTLMSRADAICRSREVSCLFFLPPFNFEGMRDLAPEVAPVLRRKVELVRDYAERGGLPLLDLSDALPAERFHDLVNEHVDWLGRRLIAACVARALTGESSTAPRECRREGKSAALWTR